MSHQSDLIANDILQYLKQHENKELLRFLTCGNVDDGKSTLIGRLLHDSKMIYEDQLAAIEKDSTKSGTTGDKVDLALLVDGLQAEREQGITIDVAYRYFSTAKRKFIIADTPGHEQYTRNMATGASTCDLAIILIDARYGVQTQTKRHSFIASLLGIKHVVVAVNKMDLMDFDEQRFNDIKAEYQGFASTLNLEDVHFVPLSALDGDNVVEPSQRSPWYQGPTLMQLLESIEIAGDKNMETFRLPVQYVNRPNLDFRGFCGTISAGSIHPGDRVVALPSQKSSVVERIVTFDGDLTRAHAGQAVTLTLADEIDISRGDVIVKADDQSTSAAHVGRYVNADIVWMSDKALTPGTLYDMKFGTNVTAGSVSTLNHLVDVNTLETKAAQQVQLNEIASVDIALDKPVVFDRYQDIKGTGSFIIIDRLTNVTVGAGMINRQGARAQSRVLDANEKARRFGQRPCIVNVTGEHSDALLPDLDQALFDMGRLAGIATRDTAVALKGVGLIALLANADAGSDVDVTLDASDNNVDALIQVLQESVFISS